jgi:hypothetical protein
VWAVGILAAGQSSTMTGTYAGQFVMEVVQYNLPQIIPRPGFHSIEMGSLEAGVVHAQSCYPSNDLCGVVKFGDRLDRHERYSQRATSHATTIRAHTCTHVRVQ